MKSFEVNFDGLVGPTHNYSGLAFGNVASLKNHNQISHPKKAALQGLEKMKTLMDLGFAQAVLPPHERPYLPILKQLGFSGTPQNILNEAYKTNPFLLFQFGSAASMWTANAATVTPSQDTLDKKLHITPANLQNKLHRSIETPFTHRVLNKIFSNSEFFKIHAPLPSRPEFGDEGAANHTRLCESYEQKGLHVFVYGQSYLDNTLPKPKNFPARQTKESCEALIRLHQIPESQVLCLQQNPDMIDAGVFHNDVISVGNRNTFFYYDLAFHNPGKSLEILRESYFKLTHHELELIPVLSSEISIEHVVSSYIFNTQLLWNGQHHILIAPIECQNNPLIKSYFDNLLSESKSSIKNVLYFDLRESMQNGGGPACLRQRILLNEQEHKACHQNIFLTDTLYEDLKSWIEKHYRDNLTSNDLRDENLLKESYQALDELTQILKLGSLYDFQIES